MKDLNLKVGDVCFIGDEILECLRNDQEHGTYTIGRGDLSIIINLDGSMHGLGGNPVVSLVPFEIPEVSYQALPKENEVCFFWDRDKVEKDTEVEVSFFDSFDNGFYISLTGNSWNYCSAENPLLNL